jgi:dCTP deaminase
MSILTKTEILEAISSGKIEITPFYSECVGPASIDLHLSNAFRIFKTRRQIIRVVDDVDYRQVTEGLWLADGQTMLLMPGETILGMTQEKIKVSDDICGWLEGRSRFARIGLLIHISASFMQPGIANHQVLEISNFGPTTLEIVPGVRICQFIFQKTLGKAIYEGIFKIQTPEEFCR